MLQRRAACARLGALACTASSAGCTALTGLARSNPSPMDIIFDQRACAGYRAQTLLVFLPGAYMTPDELVREGFGSAVRERRLPVDLWFVQTELAQLVDRTALQRLHAEIIEVARAQGYRSLWLAGISLGAFLAMGYAARWPGRVDGIVAIGAYPGRRQLLLDVQAAGSLEAWRRSAQPREADDLDHDIWAWLAGAGQHDDKLALYMGYGAEDRFGEAQALMASVLPPAQRDVVPGGHDWPPWRALWARWLDKGLLNRGPCSV
jgi:pimeloyl-ACP methyl ester carboxylesterase